MKRTGLWDMRGSKGHISAAFKIHQMKASPMGSEADIGLGHASMPPYLAVHPQKATFISFQTQPISCSQLLTHWADSENVSVWVRPWFRPVKLMSLIQADLWTKFIKPNWPQNHMFVYHALSQNNVKDACVDFFVLLCGAVFLWWHNQSLQVLNTALCLMCDWHPGSLSG